jgi:hypothetical protein
MHKSMYSLVYFIRLYLCEHKYFLSLFVPYVASANIVMLFDTLQSMLRLRLLRQGFKVKDEVWTLPKPVRPRLPKHEHEAYTTRY